jgi:hypothetical protein
MFPSSCEGRHLFCWVPYKELTSINGQPMSETLSYIHTWDQAKSMKATRKWMSPTPFLRSLVHLTHLLKHCLRLNHSPAPCKEENVITLRKPGKDPKFSYGLCSISLFVYYRQTIWETDFKNYPKTHRGNNLTKCKSIWLPNRWQHDTSMYETSGSRHFKFQP